VLWAGLEGEVAELGLLAGDLDRRFALAGWQAEARAFTAHLTLARFKGAARLTNLPRFEGPGPSEFTVTEIVLYRSFLASGGSRYETIGRYGLAS
jgi:2'-5' RNA ligase